MRSLRSSNPRIAGRQAQQYGASEEATEANSRTDCWEAGLSVLLPSSSSAPSSSPCPGLRAAAAEPGSVFLDAQGGVQAAMKKRETRPPRGHVAASVAVRRENGEGNASGNQGSGDQGSGGVKFQPMHTSCESWLMAGENWRRAEGKGLASLTDNRATGIVPAGRVKLSFPGSHLGENNQQTAVQGALKDEAAFSSLPQPLGDLARQVPLTLIEPMTRQLDFLINFESSVNRLRLAFAHTQQCAVYIRTILNILGKSKLNPQKVALDTRTEPVLLRALVKRAAKFMHAPSLQEPPRNDPNWRVLKGGGSASARDGPSYALSSEAVICWDELRRAASTLGKASAPHKVAHEASVSPAVGGAAASLLGVKPAKLTAELARGIEAMKAITVGLQTLAEACLPETERASAVNRLRIHCFLNGGLHRKAFALTPRRWRVQNDVETALATYEGAAMKLQSVLTGLVLGIVDTWDNRPQICREENLSSPHLTLYLSTLFTELGAALGGSDDVVKFALLSSGVQRSDDEFGVDEKVAKFLNLVSPHRLAHPRRSQEVGAPAPPLFFRAFQLSEDSHAFCKNDPGLMKASTWRNRHFIEGYEKSPDSLAFELGKLDGETGATGVFVRATDRRTNLPSFVLAKDIENYDFADTAAKRPQYFVEGNTPI